MSNKKLVSILTLSLLFLPLNLLAQPKSSFNTGELRLASSDLLSGYIWISNTLENEQVIYYKKEINSPVVKYYPSDVLTIDLSSGKAKYISEAILVDNIYKRVIMQIHFKGEFDLLSYYTPQKNLFFLVDNNDNFVELTNTYQEPDRSNDFKFYFKQEYKESLMQTLGGNLEIFNLIQETDFNPKEISNVLIKYHKQREIQYETFPPRVLSGFTIGIGPVVSTISHTSDINEDFQSQSPFIGGLARAGIRLFDSKLDISFLLRYNYGIISHDDSYSNSSLVTLFYEDVTRASILSEGFEVRFKPISIGKISLCLSGGGYYNQFMNYSRKVTEEILYEVDRIMVSNYFDDFEKPDPYFSLSFGGGIEYILNKSISISLNYSRSVIRESNSGVNNIQGVSIMIHKSL